MVSDHSITSRVLIEAPAAKVWAALTDPEQIKKYMGGTQVISDWRPGGEIIWRGLWQGNPYRDTGQILEAQPCHRLKYTHYSPASGLKDIPENYHILTYSLMSRGESTELVLLNENITTEAERKHLEWSWMVMLEELKRVVEEGSHS